MSVALPESVDAWRMVASGRIFQGRVPLARLLRLQPSLADDAGECTYRVEFGRDEFGVAFCDIQAEAALPLICQRTLDRFELPVQVSQRLGLLRSERDEAGLPPGYESVVLPEEGRLDPAELLEDELILAVPVVPVKPGSEAVDAHWLDASAEEEPEEARPNPFAALSALKSDKPTPGKPS